jgi:Flp pilus assembly protein TadD
MIILHLIFSGNWIDMAILRNWPLKLLLSLLALLPAGSLRWQAAAQSAGSQKTSSGDSLDVHLGNGYEALKQEQYEMAEKEFRAALALDRALVMRARFPLAVALFEQHKSVESRREFERVRQEAGEQPGIFYYLGRLDLEERNYKGAVANLSRASLHPPFPDTAFYLGLAYLKQDSNPDAEKWLQKAIELNPGDSRAEYQLATLYRKEGRQKEANQAFQQAKEIKARSDKQSQLRFECAQELDRGPSEKATSICEQLYDPNDADELTALGILYGQHGDPEKALKPLQKAAELAPQSPQMQYNLAFTYYQLKRFEDARAPLEGAVQRWPDLFPVNALYGAVLWNLGEVFPAYQTLHHAHQLNMQDASTTSLLYQSTLELARRSEEAADSEALRYLQEAASLASDAPEPHQRMAAIYKRTGRPEQATEEERKAEEIIKSSKN